MDIISALQRSKETGERFWSKVNGGGISYSHDPLCMTPDQMLADDWEAVAPMGLSPDTPMHWENRAMTMHGIPIVTVKSLGDAILADHMAMMLDTGHDILFADEAVCKNCGCSLHEAYRSRCDPQPDMVVDLDAQEGE